MKNQKMITALTNLKDAYREVIAEWNNTDLNNLQAVNKYPFDKSFDELDLDDWCDETIDELQRPLLERGSVKCITQETALSRNLLNYMNDLMNLYMDPDNENPEIAEMFYDMSVTVGFNDVSVTFDNSAAVFTGLQQMLEYIISQQ